MATQMHWAVSPVELSAGLRSSEASVRGSRLSLLGRSQRKKPTWGLFSVYTDPESAAEENSRKSSAAISSEQKIHEWVLEQAALAKKQKMKCNVTTMDVKPEVLNEAYERCRRVTAVYSKSFYWGTLLLTPEKRKAMWAIAVWCRRTDELVDGSFASYVTPSALDRWESRLEDLFAGRPYDMLDAALSDTVIKFPVVIQPFRDMIKGMRMDLNKSRYKNFDELYLYCYYVAGTVGFMCVPVMDIAPEAQATAESIYNAALAFGIANQLTNILRDVGEDARRGRIYLPQDELAQAGLSDVDVFNGKVTDKWRSFMRNQIKRARMFYHEAEKGLNTLRNTLSQDSRWAVYAASLLYQQILDEIEANDYDNFTKRACVSKANKLMMLPLAYQRSCN